MVSGYEIGMAMPGKLQPGPLAGQISFFAPVSLFFFFLFNIHNHDSAWNQICTP